MKIFLSNISYNTGAAELHELFSTHGTVISIKLMEDQNGRPRGIGFIEMSSREEAEKAITKLNGKELEGRSLSVSIAKENINRRSFGERNNNQNNRPYRKREYFNQRETR
jgi:cold-inducible RNA-binding protein